MTGWAAEEVPMGLSTQPGFPGYWFARGDGAEESPHGAWAIPNCHAFSLPRFVLAGLGSDHGWHADSHPRFLVNLTATEAATSWGSGTTGCGWRWATGQGVWPATLALQAYAPNQGGWTMERHPRMVADLTGHGRRELAGFGNDGFSGGPG